MRARSIRASDPDAPLPRTWHRVVSLLACLSVAAATLTSPNATRAAEARFDSGRLIIETASARFEVDTRLHLRASRRSGDAWQSLTLDGPPMIGIAIDGVSADHFQLVPDRCSITPVATEYGPGCRVELVANDNTIDGTTIEVLLQLEAFESSPLSLIGEAGVSIAGAEPDARVTSLVGGRITLGRRDTSGRIGISDLWILQGGSYWSRPDWILPLKPGFVAENSMKQRMAERRVGGGLPALDVWGPDGGILVGSLSKVARPISLPARVIDGERAEVAVEWISEPLPATAAIRTSPFAVILHGGDFYSGLQTYAALMAKQGLEMARPSEWAYEPIWCSWGFGPDFTIDQLREMLPVAKQMGFGVATVDAGCFAFNGDYHPRQDTFPNGEKDLRALVDEIHAHGLKAKLWLTTAIAGKQLAAQHPEWLVRDENQQPVGFTFGEGLSPGHGQFQPYMCPAVPEVLDYYRDLARRIVGEWDFDGFKMDQNFINGIPECHAPSHHHASPAASIAALADIDRVIHEEATRLKPDAIFEVCPCGAFPDFYKLPHYNQPVSSDFNTAWQIRHRGKVIKALMGARTAYYGDHFERHYSPENLPSMIGIGGIPGSMAVLRESDNAAFLRVKYPSTLTSARRDELTKWLQIYRQTWFSKGEYLNLYDIVHDRPEAHVVRKDGALYYAFFAEHWSGPVELRGLSPECRYSLVDYENNRTLGEIRGGDQPDVSFTGHLLLSAAPIDPRAATR